MFENIIEKKSNELFDLLNNGQPYIYFSDIQKNTSINQLYLSYFKAEINWWIYEEQIARRENQNFDLSHKNLTEFFKALDDIYIDLARFDIQNLKTFTHQCVSVILNYLVRPRTTLYWFVYRGEPTKTIKEITLRLAYFNEYLYLQDGYNSWLKNNSIELNSEDILSLPEFKRIIENTDHRRIFNFTIEQFIELIEPIFQFFSESSIEQEEETIPFEALIIFFDDKAIYPISERMVKDFKENNYKQVTKHFINEYLYRLLYEFENVNQDSN